MPEVKTVLDVLTLGLLGLGAYLLVLLRTGTEAAVKTSAEGAVKAAFEKFNWPAVLARELQKTRGVERQGIRFKNYGVLWAKLLPLTMYDGSVFGREAAGKLSSELSQWYFSESGGFVLTRQASDFYFALQDLLRTTSGYPEEWVADRLGESDGDATHVFLDILKTKNAVGAIRVLDYLSTGDLEDWQDKAAGHAKEWRKGIKDVAASWSELTSKQRFATLQQVGSVLRTALVNDLESRAI